MKKVFSLIFYFCFISILVFSQNVLEINKKMIVKENLRLRTEESTNSSVITTMGNGTKVRIIKIGKKDSIDNLDSSWVQIELLEDGKDKNGNRISAGIKGWCYGGYLTDYKETIYDSLDLTDSSYKKGELIFKTDLDKKAWEKLAGLYFVGKPRTTITTFREIDTDWGKDYSFGLGCHSIWYENGKWYKGGDGEAEDFSLVSISDNGNSYLFKSPYSTNTITWTYDGYKLTTGNSEYYKFTGPDCYKHFIKDFVSNYRKKLETTKDYDLGDLPKKILIVLSKGDNKEFAKFVTETESVNLVIGDYSGNSKFSKAALNTEQADVIEAFEFIKADLKKHSNLFNVEPHINEFIYTTKERFLKLFPDGEIFLEYSLATYEEISLVFKNENDQIKLIGIIDYSVFRP